MRSFRIHGYEGEAELEALPAGLVLTIRDDLKEIAAIQIIQWPQVAAWMEAAEWADGQEPPGGAIDRMQRRALLGAEGSQ